MSGDEEDRNLARNELFAGLSILACANGLGSRVIQAIKRAGWTDAALGNFEISAIVFTAACAAGVWLILRDRRGEPWSLTCGPVFVASWGFVRPPPLSISGDWTIAISANVLVHQGVLANSDSARWLISAIP